MIEKLTPSRVIFNIFNYAFMVLFCVICVAPLWHVLMASISDPRTLMATGGILWKPAGTPTFEAYRIIFQNSSILTGYFNTLIYVVGTTVLGIALLTLAGFVLSRKTGLRRFFSFMVVFTMLFSGGLLPSYMINTGLLHMLNTRAAVIIPGCINAFYIILVKNSFEQLPASFEESAKLDGAGPLRIMVSILVPLIKATIAVMVMFLVVQQWNSWFQAAIYLPKRRDLWPLQLFMREILVQNDTKMISADEAAKASSLVGNLVKYGITIVGTLPILCVYPFVQKYFVKGVTLGGVKG